MRPFRRHARGPLAAASLLLTAPVAAQQPEPAPAEQPAAPQLTKAPELQAFVQADYPPEAQQQGLTASVRFLITIAEDGTVAEVQPTEPAGHGFDEAAAAAVRQFRFSPAEVDGKPAPVQVEYVYHFTLSAPAPAPAEEAPPPQATLKGQLISRGSRSRVAHATVRCGDAADAPEALSDADGRFELTVPAGPCAVRVVASDYQLFSTTEVLKENETAEVNYYLAPAGGAYETVVRSERPKKEVVRRTVSREEAQKTPGTFGDPIRVIQALPGVARAPFISGELLVRGSNPGQTATMMDGVRIPLLFHLLGGPSVVNAEFIDSLDFFPGGYGGQYGRAVGGVVDVATRKGARDTLHGSVKVDLLDAGFFVEAPLAEGVSVAAAARRSYIDAILPHVLPEDEDGGSLLVVPRYWDYQVRLDFGSPRAPEPGEGRSTYYLMAFGGDDQLRVVATGGARRRAFQLETHQSFHRVKGDWTYRKGALTSVFAPYAGYDLNRQDFGTYKEDDDIYSLGARETLTLEVAPELRLRTGFDIHFDHLKMKVQFPTSGRFDYVPFPGAEPASEVQHKEGVRNSFDGAVFLETDLTLGAFTLTPGVRGNYLRVHGVERLALDPRLWARFAAAERTHLKGSLGLYSQPPDVWQYIPVPYGNPLLGYERAFQASLGVEHRLTDSFTVDVTGFFNRRYENVVAPGRYTTDAEGVTRQERYSNDGLGRAYGVEVMLKKELTDKVSGWLSYTLSHSEDGRAGPLPQRPGRGTSTDTKAYDLSPWDQTHVLTLVGGYKLGNGWELGGRFRYTTGRPTTPLQHTADLYRSDSNRYSPTPGLSLSARTQAFHQLDVRLDKSWRFDSWTLGAYIDVQNLYNASNVEATFEDYRFREQYEVPGIPFLPVVGVKGSF
ncbi:TonB family protein [Myxococcaceae bacterium GXIMD 01537]